MKTSFLRPFPISLQGEGGHNFGELYFAVPSWPKLVQKNSLEHTLCNIIFVILTQIIPPEDFLCNVAAAGMSFFGRKQARECAL